VQPRTLDLPAVGSRVRLKFLGETGLQNVQLRAHIGHAATVLNNTSGSGHPLYVQFDDDYRTVLKPYEVEPA
jgi:hypothetical protein